MNSAIHELLSTWRRHAGECRADCQRLGLHSTGRLSIEADVWASAADQLERAMEPAPVTDHIADALGGVRDH